ncbi:MAG: hypothetical protein AAFW46_14230 [Pseudomonadota bacterium]
MPVLRCARALALSAAAFFGAATGAPAQSCTDTLPATCLQSFGAGTIAAQSGAAVDCSARLDDYRTCITRLVQQGGSSARSMPPLSRAEFGFLSALEAELADNVGRLEAFVDGLDLTGARAVYENDWPALRMRFFNATDNPAYFVAPAEWLTRTQGFYDDVETMLTRKDVRNAFRRQATSVLYERRLAKERLQELVALGRDELLPEISAEIAAGGR